MKLPKIIPSLVFVTLILWGGIACSSTPTPDTEATEQAALVATQTAQPTDTPVPPTATPVPPTATPVPPTNTPKPTNTPPPPTNTPTSTPTPLPPTNTPTSTTTPAPTDTPTAAATPTPAPPTFTPTPAISPAEVKFQEGVDALKQEKWNEAIAAFQAAIQLDPEFGLAYEGLGYSYANQGEFEPAIEQLQKYLQLVPEAEDRAEVEADIAQMQQSLADNPLAGVDIPEGKALFYFLNYSGETWNVDVGPYFLEVPPNPPGQEYHLSTIIIDPGAYTWQAHSASANYYITDESGNRSFEFTVAAGEAYGTSCCR